MDQPGQGFEINRLTDKYLITNARVPKLVLFRDLVLTCAMWAFYGIAFYRAFLYIESLQVINKLPNLSKQQKVVLADFYEDLRIYLIILAVLIIYLSTRLITNLGKWRKMRKQVEVTLPQVSAKQQANFFKANEEDVIQARSQKICMIDTSSEDGSVLSVEIIKA